MARKKRNLHLNNYIDDSYNTPLKVYKNIDKITKLHNFKLKEIEAKTHNQSRTFDAYYKDKNLLLHGSAGTGKTVISMYLSLFSLLGKSKYNDVSVVRSVVPTMEVGHLPGDLYKKIEIYRKEEAA